MASDHFLYIWATGLHCLAQIYSDRLCKLSRLVDLRNQVKGFGRQKRHSEIYRDSEYTADFLPKVEFEIVVAGDRAHRAVEAILGVARTKAAAKFS